MSEIKTSDKTLGYEDCIANGIPSRAFRYAAENKNLLTKKGSLYIGTGETRTTTMLLDAPSWNAYTIYYLGDIVNNQGNTWRCKVDNVTGSQFEPGTYAGDEKWQNISVGFISYKTGELLPPTKPNTTWTLKAVVDENGVATLQWVEESED